MRVVFMQDWLVVRESLGSKVTPARILILTLMLSAVWFLLSAEQVLACSCVQPGSPIEELGKFDAVFAGKVFVVQHSYDPNAKSVTREDRTTIGFEVSTVWKGAVHETMYITTPPMGGSCGYTFVEGEEYIVYASDSHYGDDSYTANICSRTALLSAAQADLDALGEGEAPRAGTKGPAPEATQSGLNAGWVFALVLAAAILIVGAGGFVAYASTGRR